MLIHFLKFFHVLITVGLLGSALYCLILIFSKKAAPAHCVQHDQVTCMNKIMLLLLVLAMLTGTFLVYPKQFTFHTHWIQAAYFLSLLCIFGISLLILFKKKIKMRSVWMFSYLVLIVILIGIIHDAVTKSTFVF